MSVETLRLGPGERLSTGRCRVYRRARWADDWIEDSSLVPIEITWSCLPVMPTATLLLHYGRVRWFDDSRWMTELKRTGMLRGYVKIVVDMDWDVETSTYNTRTWYGVVEVQSDRHDGAVFTPKDSDDWTSIATGSQTFVVYGLEQLLAEHKIARTGIEYDGDETSTDAVVEFNRDGKGNRNNTRYGGVYVFAQDIETAKKWSSYDIVEYLLRRETPRDRLGGRLVQFRLHEDAWLPSWDTPVIDPTEQTTLAVIQRIATRQRLISAWFEVAEDGDEEIVELHTDTITTAPIPIALEGAEDDPVPECSAQWHLICDEDQFTELSVKDSDLPTYDVVVVTGAPEICVGTFGYSDDTLEDGWTSEEEYQYEQGGAAAGVYSTLPLAKRQELNAARRGAPELDRVFSAFKIPYDWDGEVGDGLNGTAKATMFPGPDSAPNRTYYPVTFVQSSLPLKKGANYSGDTITRSRHNEDKASRDWLHPLVYFKRPDTSRWVRAEDIGKAGDLEIEAAGAFGAFSVHVRIPQESHGFELRVTGAPQHAIAYGHFTRLPEDKDYGRWAYDNANMVATLAMYSGRRTQGQWPAESPADKDTIKTLVIDAGNGFASVYVAPQTVVGVGADGQLSRSDGGWLYRPEDAPEQLVALAKIAAAWYSVPHRAVAIETRRLNSDLWLGDMIVRIGDERGDNPHQATTNAPISELRIAWPLDGGGEPTLPTMSISTFATELDPLQLGPMPYARRSRNVFAPVPHKVPSMNPYSPVPYKPQVTP